jgi:prophage regulatory protein
MTKRLLRLPAVLEKIPISRSAWWAGIRAGRFPKPIKLGPRTSAWREEEIDSIIDRGKDHNVNQSS